MITLLYVEGLTPNDEPVFSSINNQEQFFARQENKVVDNGYYPAHYRNSIKLESEDISEFTRYNYVALTNYTDTSHTSSKTYYYFIESLEYINEGIIQINIIMDTIQTYMFDMKIPYYVSDRETINRWESANSAYINRKYIRENLGFGEMVENKSEYLVGTDTCHLAIYSASKNSIFADNNYGVQISNIAISQPCIIKVFADIDDVVSAYIKNGYTSLKDLKSSYVEIKWTDNVTGNNEEYLLGNVAVMCSTNKNLYGNAGLSKVVRIPLEFIGGLYSVDKSTTYNGMILDLTSSTILCTNVGGNDYPWLYNFNTVAQVKDTNINELSVKEKTSIISFGFLQNKFKLKPFKWEYCPQLCDSNYMSITLGDYNEKVSYPIELLTGSIRATIILDLYSAQYIYRLSDPNNTFYNNYSTQCVSALSNEIQLLSDAYQQYISANKFRWLGTLKNVASLALSSGRHIGSGSSIVESASENTSNIRQLGARNKWKKWRTSQSNSSNYNTSDTMSNTSQNNVSGNIHLTGSEPIGLIESGLNAMYTPNEIRTDSEATQLYLGGGYRPYYTIFVNNQIEQIAKYFESNGYKTHNLYNDLDIIKGDCTHRYYYNIFQSSDMSVYLSNVPSDQTTLLNIKQRFAEGFRLWLCDEYYLRGHLGKVCEYDNVETFYF